MEKEENYNMMGWPDYLIDRFLSKIIFPEDLEKDCWIWNGSFDGKPSHRYGRIVFVINGNSSVHKAHRFSYEFYNGKIPEGLCILHKCDNPACVNPYHLWMGTNKDNTDDCISKDRHSRGENNGRSLYTDELILKIYEYCLTNNTSKVSEVSTHFNISDKSIIYIVKGKLWKHLYKNLSDYNKKKLLNIINKCSNRLTEGIVYQIKYTDSKTMTQKQLSIKYNVSVATISHILTKTTWAHV